MNMATLKKETLRLTYSSEVLYIIITMKSMMTCIQADIVLERELRVLHLDPQAGTKFDMVGQTSASESSKSTPVTHFLQQGHTFQ